MQTWKPLVPSLTIKSGPWFCFCLARWGDEGLGGSRGDGEVTVCACICMCVCVYVYWTGKGQFSFQSQRKAMPKNVQTTAQLHSSHTLVKSCSKFCKPGYSNTWTMNFLMFKLVLEKAEEPEIKLPASAGSWKKQESSRKTSISALLTMPKPLTVWITINCGKFWKRWDYQTTWRASWEICMQVGNNS